MAYVTRSMEGVRQVTPLSSRLLRESNRFEGAAKSAMQVEAAQEAAYEVKRGTQNTTKRESEAAAQRAIMAGQQMAVQGDFKNSDILSPLRQEFFGSMSGLPQFQKAAMLDKYTPEFAQQNEEFRKQRMLNQQEQKSFLQLQDAQRKARFTQAADALQVPVSRRIEEIMSSGGNDKSRFSSLQQSLFENPEALGNPLVASLYDTAFKSVGDKLDAKQKRKNMRTMQESNMLAQAISSGNTEVVNALRKGGGKGGKSIFENAAKLAEAKQASDKQIKSTKAFDNMIASLRGADIDTFNSITSQLGAAPSPIQQLEVNILRTIKAKEQQGIAVDAKTKALANFTGEAKRILQAADEFESNDKDLGLLIKLLSRVAINDEELSELLGEDLPKLQDITNPSELISILTAAQEKLNLEGNVQNKVADKMAQLGTKF